MHNHFPSESPTSGRDGFEINNSQTLRWSFDEVAHLFAQAERFIWLKLFAAW
jgi:hypothetical protein